MRRVRAVIFASILCLFAAGSSGSAVPTQDEAWAFPILALSIKEEAPSNAKTISLEGSPVLQSPAALSDLFHAVDWRPDDHPVMPTAVREGAPPDEFACGFCHLPTGQGRPENAALSGLSADDIIQQVADMKSGLRAEADPSWRPGGMMLRVARALKDGDTAAAAKYFSSLTFTSRVKVKEASIIPAATAQGAVYNFSTTGQVEPLGQRIVEGPTDLERFEKRDDRVEYMAYVPMGSVARGRNLAQTGDHGRTQACEICHGQGLSGRLGPPLAGRSPSYVFRQLLAFNSGSRHGPGGDVMKGVVAHRRTGDMIDLAAFTATLRP